MKYNIGERIGMATIRKMEDKADAAKQERNAPKSKKQAPKMEKEGK